MTSEAGNLAIPVVWHDDCLRHQPGGEVWLGLREEGTEVPERARVILRALTSAGAPVLPPRPHDEAALLAVHDRALVTHLATIWADWEAGRYPADYGRDRVVPYVFPTAAMLAGLPLRTPAATHGQVGMFCYDTMTLVGPGSWEAIRAAADSARTAAALITAGQRAVYALCRPPGHHAAPAGYGGSCYLNNAAVAADELHRRVGGPVAVVDIDAHHGNGTQEIFLSSDDILTASVHVDPGAGWFPHFLGFADESNDSNLNLPLAPGTGDEEWLAAVRRAAAFAGSARALVVALGVDAAAGDPESPLEVTAAGYREAGRILGELGLPTVVVQEGGYDLETIGELVVETLSGLAAV